MLEARGGGGGMVRMRAGMMRRRCGKGVVVGMDGEESPSHCSSNFVLSGSSILSSILYISEPSDRLAGGLDGSVDG